MEKIEKGLDYVKSIPFILKIAEFVVLLIAFSLAGHFLNSFDSFFFAENGNKEFINIFLILTILGWLISIVCPIFFIFGIHEKFSNVPWTLIVAIVSATSVSDLVIGSSLLAVAVKRYNEEKTYFFFESPAVCKEIDATGDANCGHLIGGTILGFIASLLFAVDMLIHGHMFIKARAVSASQAVPVNPVVLQISTVQPVPTY